MLNSYKHISHTTAYQIYQISRLAAVILISIILVKSGYDTEGVSRYERFLFLANLFTFFWVMGIKNAALSYYGTLSKEKQANFFFNTFLSLQVAGLIFGVTVYFLSVLHLFGADSFNLNDRVVLAVYIFLYAPTVITEVIFILFKRSGLIIKYGFGIHFLQLGIIGCGALLGLEVSAIIKLLLIVIALRWIYTVYIVLTHSEHSISIKHASKFILFSLPLIGHMMLSNGMEFIDGLLVNKYFDPGNFAVFRYGARELPFILILISAVSSTAIPLAVQNIKKSAGSIKKHTLRLMHLFFPASILLMWISPYLFSFFYSVEYLESAAIFNIYLLILASRILLPEVFLYGKHQNNTLMFFSLGELIVNLILSLVLLPVFGLLGIAAATVIAYMASKLSMALFLWIKYQIIPKEYISIKLYLVYTIILYVNYFLAKGILQV